MDIQKELQSLGFNKNEAEVYLTLYKKGSAKAGELIKLTKIHRNLVYQSLERLVEKGFAIQVIKGKIAQFEAVDPQRLLEHFEHQKNQAHQIIEALHKEREHESRDIRVYDGIQGVIQAREQTYNLKKGDTLYVLGSSPASSFPELEKEWRKYHIEREKRGINFRILYEHTVDPEHVVWRNNQTLTQARILPSAVKSPIWFESYGDIFGIGIPCSDPILFTVRSKEAAEGLRQYFEYLWNQEVVVDSGVEAIELAFYEMLNELSQGEEYFVIGASQAAFDRMNKDFFLNFHRKRIEKGVYVSMLCYEDFSPVMKKLFSQAGDMYYSLSHIKPLASETMIPLQVNLFRNKAFLILYGENPCVMRIERADVYKTFKAYFDSHWNQDTFTLKGSGAIVRLCNMVLDECKDVYLIGANGSIMKSHNEFYKTFTEERVKKQIRLSMLAVESVRGTEFSRLPLSSVRYMPQAFESPMVVWIFGDYVAHVLWHEPQHVTVMYNKNIAEYYRRYYEALKLLSKEH